MNHTGNPDKMLLDIQTKTILSLPNRKVVSQLNNNSNLWIIAIDYKFCLIDPSE